MKMNEIKVRAAIAALPEIIRLVKDNPKVIDPETGGRRVDSIQSIVAEVTEGLADELMKRLYKETEKKFSISDARDGDILVAGHESCPFIYNGHHDETEVGAYCGLNVIGQFCIPFNQDTWVKPPGVLSLANGQEVNRLFLKMYKAGYVWDPVKKELKMIQDVVPEQKPISDETREEMIKQYCKMMKDNEGKSFEERRDAINNFRSGKL